MKVKFYGKLNRIIDRKWQIKAENDLKTIANELASSNPITDTICYHSQQAAEKYLKLFLVAKMSILKKLTILQFY